MENTMIGKSLFIGEAIELAELDPERDAAAVATWTRQPAFSRKLFRHPFKPLPITEVKKKLQEILKAADENHQAIYFGIQKTGSPDLIGMLWFPWVDAQHQSSWMNLVFGSVEDIPSYGWEALRMAVYYAFMEMSLHRIAVEICSDEPQMLSLYEEFGFLREVQRREAVFSQDRYYDEYVYGLLKSDWKQKQSEKTL